MFRHLNDAPPQPSQEHPGLGQRLDLIINRAMAKDPQTRFATAGDLAEAAHVALLNGTQHTPIAAHLSSPTPATTPISRPRRPRVIPTPTLVDQHAGHRTPTPLTPLPRPEKKHTARNVSLVTAGVLVAATLVIGYLATLPAPVAPAPAFATGNFFTWNHAGGEHLVNALAIDLSGLAVAAKAEDLAATGQECTSLQRDVEAAQGYPAKPDTEAQTHWAASLAQLALASSDCLAAVSTGDANNPLFTRMASEITNGGTEATKAATREKLLNK
jgi:hypothetical protein